MDLPKFGRDVWSAATPQEVPAIRIGPLDPEVFASYSGPDCGLKFVEENLLKKNGNHNSPSYIAGIDDWNKKEQRAYGICLSLYEQHPVSGKMSGDPIADAFAICCRKNNVLLLIADGVNWGEKPKLAARCALYGCMCHLNKQMFEENNPPQTTQEALVLLRKAFDMAHQTILDNEGGLTTVCACLILPVIDSDQSVCCCLNVGDSFSYVFSHNNGIREISIGSHNVMSERDIRDAQGALGPVDGNKPELRNLTYSVTVVDPGDIVFLTTDGISDNFDPVVGKIAIPKPNGHTGIDPNPGALSPISPTATTSLDFDKPEMDPRERHIYAMKEMERVVHEFELVTEEQCSAQELCSALVQHTLTLTDSKRKILENPLLYVRRKMTLREKQKRDSDIIEKLARAPGKLDHASIVAFEVGVMGEEEEMDTVDLEKTEADTNSNADEFFDGLTTIPLSPPPDECVSPLSPTSKKSSGKRFFSKFKSVASLPSSPISSKGFHLPISPRKSKRNRIKTESEPQTPTSPQVPQSPPTVYSNLPRRKLLSSPTSPTSPEPSGFTRNSLYARSSSHESSV